MRKLNFFRRSHNITQLYLHLVFVTKHRNKMLDATQDDVIRECFADLCRSIGHTRPGNPAKADTLCHLIEFGMEEDHVHLVVRFCPSISVSDLVKHLKGGSSRRGLPLRPDKKRGPALWAAGYFAKTVGHMSGETTGGYVRDQGKPKTSKVQRKIDNPPAPTVAMS